MAKSELRLEGVVAGYGDGVALRGVDLQVGPGERVGLLGRNGAGKTTLLRTIMGLVAIRSGTLHLGDTRLDQLATFEIARCGIAYVPQGRELFAEFTVRQNLAIGLIGSRGPGHSSGRRSLEGQPQHGDIDLAIGAFPWLAARAGDLAGSLSGGEQQQLAIARALVSKPDLLLLDEPLEGVQPSVVDEIVGALDAICGTEAMSVLLVEQNTDVVLSLCQRVVFIESGRIADAFDSAELRRNPVPIETHLGL